MVLYPEMDRFPHMLAADIDLWRRFLTLHKGEFLVYNYDVHVGVGAPIPLNTPEQYVKAIEASSQKRIDVVAEKDSEIWVIEVKPYASLSAVGQVLCYSALYIDKFKPVKKVIPCIVTDYIYPDEAWLFNHFKITAISVLLE